MAVPTTLHIGRPCMQCAPSRRRGLGGGRLAAVPRVGLGGGWGEGGGGREGGGGGSPRPVAAGPRGGCIDPPPWGGGVSVPARHVPPLAGPWGGEGGGLKRRKGGGREGFGGLTGRAAQ